MMSEQYYKFSVEGLRARTFYYKTFWVNLFVCLYLIIIIFVTKLATMVTVTSSL